MEMKHEAQEDREDFRGNSQNNKMELLKQLSSEQMTKHEQRHKYDYRAWEWHSKACWKKVRPLVEKDRLTVNQPEGEGFDDPSLEWN